MFFDDVVVDGAGRCEGTGVVDVETISDDGAGSYSVDLTDAAGGPAPTWVTCSWDSPPAAIEGSDVLTFE